MLEPAIDLIPDCDRVALASSQVEISNRSQHPHPFPLLELKIVRPHEVFGIGMGHSVIADNDHIDLITMLKRLQAIEQEAQLTIDFLHCQLNLG